MRILALLAFVHGIAGTFVPVSAQSPAHANVPTSRSPAVVELFTSQGCSSCPEADALLGRLASRADVVALSMSVNYWDYLGWKDTLANAKFSERQVAYKASLGISMVYTPMAVVNGVSHLNGSDEASISRAIESAITSASPNVPVRMSEEKGKLKIETGGAFGSVPTKESTLWLAVITKRVEVPIARGENRGKTVTYHNVVRELIPVGMWSGHPVTVQLDKQTFMRDGADRCAVLVQQGRGGPIIGAAMMNQF